MQVSNLVGFPFSVAFSKLRKAAISFVMTARPHGTTQLPLDGFGLILILEHSSKL